MRFRHASDELQVSSPSLNPTSHSSRIPLSSARHTRFGESQAIKSKASYSCRSPPKRNQEQALPTDGMCKDNFGPQEPWSSGYHSRMASPDAWTSADEHNNDVQCHIISKSSPTQAKISEWLKGVDTEPNSCMTTENAARALRTATDCQHYTSPRSIDSNKENTSPTRSFSPIQPPITHMLLSTPSRFRYPPTYPRIHSQTPSRIDHISTPRGYLSTPPRRNYRRPANKLVKSTEDESALQSNSNSTSSTVVNSDVTAADSPSIAIYIDPQTPQLDTAGPYSPASCLLSQAPQVEKRRDCTVPPSLIPSALATLSPAVSISRKGKGRLRNYRSTPVQDEREQKEIRDPRQGRTEDGGDRSAGSPVQSRAQTEHTVNDRGLESTDSEEERIIYSEKKVLRSGREVDVLGVSRDSEALCQEKPFTQDAEGKTFDFMLEDAADHDVEA